MTPADRERDLLDSLLPITDPTERLSVIAAGWQGPGMPAELRTDDLLVPGCVSRVHLLATRVAGRLHLQWDADSSLVRGLVGLLCAVYQDTSLAASAAHACALLQSLGLDRQLSPTRLRGLENVIALIRARAAALLGADSSAA